MTQVEVACVYVEVTGVEIEVAEVTKAEHTHDYEQNSAYQADEQVDADLECHVYRLLLLGTL